MRARRIYEPVKFRQRLITLAPDVLPSLVQSKNAETKISTDISPAFCVGVKLGLSL
jgi:hypothetical protein